MTSLDETSSLLDPFLALLDDPAPSNVPAQTLLGAITHFISTLDDAQLARFIASLARSLSLPKTNGVSSEDIRAAVKLGVVGLVMRMENEKKGVYFGSYRRSKAARQWLDGVLHATRTTKDTVGPRTQVLIGLLQGVEESQTVDWGQARVKLEEKVVLALSGDEQTGDLEPLCVAMPHVGVYRLLALDLQPLSDKIADHIFVLLAGQQDLDQIPIYASALSRSYVALYSEAASNRRHTLQAMSLFCQRMEGLGLGLGKKGASERQADSRGTGDKDLHKTAFSAFLLPASSILDVLLQNMSGQEESVDLAGRIIRTMFAFSCLTASGDGFENYHRLLAGCLDITSQRGGVAATESLFSHISSEGRLSDAKAAFVLILGDELLHQLGSRSIDLLLPLAERHAHRSESRPSFEAAHAFFLSLLRVSSETLQSASPQTDFFDALLPSYLSILTKRAKSGDIMPDQLKQALPLITSYAARRDHASVSLCLQALSLLPPSPATRLIQIRLAPHIPSSSLPAYLQNLGEMMRGVDESSYERMELMGEAFQMISRDLRDEDKRSGVEWWMSWKQTLGQKPLGFVRSRL
ncbi:hypothetical protein L198_03051 [Cryptococcus wingfieldii CBS 7118]|uniref:Nucleolar 27S pre-rRNA processing Urb2/Npa2 C-terminal domain-containing protein n=1 Tax=Cryptococcus wingfieldii CBS 7118 TaxID=1295528 RepID=A0A1E3JIR9_9TREE|nr:hypothetical protein L198_03051 [Cryptococcus wingfieldii CBS 7118]ODO00725.1 hypothetical protein L198_03051 [Cryptococcus wingfieldii CBS 7118]